MRARTAYRVTIHSNDSLWHKAYLVVTPQRDSVNALAQACLRAAKDCPGEHLYVQYLSWEGEVI